VSLLSGARALDLALQLRILDIEKKASDSALSRECELFVIDCNDVCVDRCSH
jgi:hypothetical protein